jgi:hypothetical protein
MGELTHAEQEKREKYKGPEPEDNNGFWITCREAVHYETVAKAIGQALGRTREIPVYTGNLR